MLLQALCIISYPLVNSNWSYSPKTTNLGQIRRFLEPCDIEIWWMTLKNNKAPLLCYFKLCASFPNHWRIQIGITIWKRPLWVKFDIVELCDLEIWQMTLKNNKAPLLCYFKLCASFPSHWRIQIWITVRKRPIWVKFDIVEPCDLEIWWMTFKTIGHLFYATSSFVHHCVAIDEFKLDLQSRNAQSGSNWTLFRAVWPKNLTDNLEKQ